MVNEIGAKPTFDFSYIYIYKTAVQKMSKVPQDPEQPNDDPISTVSVLLWQIEIFCHTETFTGRFKCLPGRSISQKVDFSLFVYAHK